MADPPKELPGPTPEIAGYTISCDTCGQMSLVIVRWGTVTQAICTKCNAKMAVTLEMSVNVETKERSVKVRLDRSP